MRNCIRPDTYRYYGFEANQFKIIWSNLEETFGSARRFGDLDLHEILGKSLLLRAVFNDLSITVIKKKGLEQQDFEKFEEIIGFK